MFEANPRHLAGKSARCAPPEKPFALFFEISPRRISFLAERGLVGGSPAINGRGGTARVGTADALARNIAEQKILERKA